MTDSTRLICAVLGSILFYLGLKAARTGRFDTMQGTLLRGKRPRIFAALVVFWLTAAGFLFATAVGAFAHRP